MKFIVKRDILLKSLNFVQGVVEKKNTLPILSNVLLQLKDNKLSIVATDLDIVFHDEINEVKITKEGSTTTSAAILYDILRKISSNSENTAGCRNGTGQYPSSLSDSRIQDPRNGCTTKISLFHITKFYVDEG